MNRVYRCSVYGAKSLFNTKITINRPRAKMLLDRASIRSQALSLSLSPRTCAHFLEDMYIVHARA